jgi:type VI protein secretion system component VasF|tara:strand:+ start:203 stop:382 length:180 start_codon:yes stop_codon:yes gene_type:complete
MLAKTNKAQRAAIYRKWQQNSQGKTYREFRKTVHQGFGCLMVCWSGMWLGIEPDGHTHS